MHFWIDKRSQQCGFGRSRVAASLSHAGSVLTGSGTIVPLVARGSHYSHHGSTRYQPRTQQQQLLHQQQQQQQQHQQQQHQQQQHYSYHHPQFGNMAVPMRHYDAHQQQQYSGNVYA